MKSIPRLLAAFVAACFVTAMAFAADGSPAGTWKWTQQGRQGGQGVERTLTLDFKDGKLTGVLKGAKMGEFEIPDREISNGSFKDGVVSFSVTLEFNGNTRTTKYEGKLAGDTITGSSEAPGRDGGTMKREWVVKRAK